MSKLPLELAGPADGYRVELGHGRRARRFDSESGGWLAHGLLFRAGRLGDLSTASPKTEGWEGEDLRLKLVYMTSFKP